MALVSEEGQKNDDHEHCVDGNYSDGKCENSVNVEGESGGAVAREVPEIPDELVERIVARMPFPSLFKAASLSKAWQSKFFVSSSGMRPSSLSFREQVASVSSRWPIYRPVYVETSRIVGFNRDTSQWESTIPLSYLPVSDLRFATFTGALMCVITEDNHLRDFESWNLFVTNVITKRYRKLPQPPSSVQLGRMFTPEDHVTILPSGASGYRVLVLHRGIADHTHMHDRIYDSKLQAWAVREPSVLHSMEFCLQSAYLDEKVYLLCDPNFDGFLHLWVYDIRENSWTQIPQRLHMEDVINGAVSCCGNKVMVAVSRVTCKSVGNFYSMVIYELHPCSLALKYVDTSPQNHDPDIWDVDLDDTSGPAFFFASDADFLYFRQKFPARGIATFNVHTHEWSSLPLAQCSSLPTTHLALGAFEPGVNPFMDL